MENDVFLILLRSLGFILRDRCKDIGFIKFLKMKKLFYYYRGLCFGIICSIVKYFE